MFFDLSPVERHSRRIAPFDPFRDMEDMERAIFGSNSTAVSMFRTDVADTGDAFKLECELPGFKKEDINIDIENDVLTISAERKYEKNEGDENKTNYLKRERFYGSFSRSFDVSGVNVDAIDAEYVDGMLNVILPKKVEQAPASRRLEIR